MSATLERTLRPLAPVAFGLTLLIGWQAAVRGFAVPRILLPAPSDIVSALSGHSFELWHDWQQTILRGALPGFAIGSASGFLIALAIQRWPAVSKGLVPLSALFAAMPIIGIAPIMVMWFGFDWQSKAAVVALMTFFPTLAMTGAGLATTDAIHLDLLRSYGASYGRTLWHLRLPSALPHIFTALKLGAPSSVIGSMIAEFFGTPTYGLGFRMSAEIGRLGFDVVWAAIVVAALSGSVLYGLIALSERFFTAWRPSNRS